MMPRLADFAAKSTRFVDATSSASWTAPSVATLLTGLLPTEHGVRGQFAAPPLAPSVATLAEYLKSLGYSTTAFTGGGWVSEEMGFGQGFDRYVPEWTLRDPQGHLARWLERRDRDRPFFLFLHTYEAHDPYGQKYRNQEAIGPAERERGRAFVEKIRSKMAKPEDDLPAEMGREILLGYRADPVLNIAMLKAFGRAKTMRAVVAYDRDVFRTSPDRKEMTEYLRGRYREGLQWTDEGLGALVARFDAAGLPPNTVTVVVSDHGESFGEHDNLGHGRWLFDELTRILLLVRAPGSLPLATPVRGSCGLLDVLPTVLDLCGCPRPKGTRGRSLLALARGDATGRPIPAEEARIAQENTERIGQWLASVRSDRAKWIALRDPRSPLAETVFDLGADPAEQRGVPASAEAPGEIERHGAEFSKAVEEARERLRRIPRD